MNAISINEVTMRYGEHRAVDGLTIALERGDIFGFLGPNGAGKTTTIRVLLGFLRAREGSAQVLGMDAWQERHRIHEQVGYISGDLRLYKWMTLNSALDIFGKVRKRSLTKTGLDLAERFALDPATPVKAMSRGMRQKIGLILALAHEPSVLILDEPTTALDPPMKKTLFDYLRDRSALGNTVFFSSHSLSEVEDLCDQVAFLRAGRLVEHEKLSVLRKRAQRHVTVEFKPDAVLPLSGVPDCIQLIESSDYTWDAMLRGDVQDFMQWCTQHPIADVTISPPDLDRLFHTYYSASETLA